MEIWKDIPGYEGRYQASTRGRIKSLLWYADKILKPTIKVGKKEYSGYSFVCLKKNPQHTEVISIHRLIALTFIPNPENKEQVNHIDCCRSNNSVDNLEWCTRAENMAQLVRHNQINIYKKKKAKYCWNISEIRKKTHHI
jgi:hypothetical protein